MLLACTPFIMHQMGEEILAIEERVETEAETKSEGNNDKLLWRNLITFYLNIQIIATWCKFTLFHPCVQIWL
jgi:hypothetical protein